MPPTENAYFETASIELEIHRGLWSGPGYPRFNMVIVGVRRNGVLQIRKHFEGHGKMAGLAFLELHAASDIKTAIIVNDDIDPSIGTPSTGHFPRASTRPWTLRS